VTLRAFGVEEVARLAAECGLTAIEWGGDVHVPPGDDGTAARAVRATAAAGLTTASYGSYLLADGDASPDAISCVLDTALALGAPNVRVWAPLGVEPGSSRTGEVVDALRRIADGAESRGLTVGLEFHGGTLTATAASTGALLDAVDAPNLSTYWQPPYWLPSRAVAEDAAEVTDLATRLSHLHVYEWRDGTDRRALDEGAGRWRAVLAALAAEAGDRARVAFLEFVAADSPDALRADARTLHQLLREAV
jgi:sugar phosphate isomerase/epimerase